jgi:fructose/tagatose bisphosphate aldolase
MLICAPNSPLDHLEHQKQNKKTFKCSRNGFFSCVSADISEKRAKEQVEETRTLVDIRGQNAAQNKVEEPKIINAT